MSATELTPAILRQMGCVSAQFGFILDDESSAELEFAKPVTLGGYGAELTFDNKSWWIRHEGWSKRGESQRRWTIELEDEEGRKNRTPYLGRPDWLDVFHTIETPKCARVSVLMAALGEEWNEEDAVIPVPALSGGESIGDIKKTILHWVQRNTPMAAPSHPSGAVLRYGAPTSSTRATGEIRMNFKLLPIGGLHSGFYVNGAPVKLSGNTRVGASGLATAINSMNAGVTATASGTRVNLTATTAGESGNDISIAARAEEGDVILSDSTLTGGADSYTDSILVQGTPASVTLEPIWYQSEEYGYPVYIGSRVYEFWKGRTENPAYQLAQAITAAPDAEVTAEYRSWEDTSRVLLTAKTPGAAGNSITLEKDAPDDYAISGETLTGGSDGVPIPATTACAYLAVDSAENWSSGVFISLRDSILNTYSATFDRTSASAFVSAYNSSLLGGHSVASLVDSTTVKISALSSGESGNRIQVSLPSSNVHFAVSQTVQFSYGGAQSVNFAGGASAHTSDPVAATGWIDCCTGYIELDESRVAEPPASTLPAWSERISALIGFTATETAEHDSIVVERTQDGENPISIASDIFFKAASDDGTDAHYEDVTVSATAATGYIDLAETGTHPIIEHTGLFVNDKELLGAGLSAADVVNVLNADTEFGVTASLVSGSVADGIVYLTARETGQEGNTVPLFYSGAPGVDLSAPFLRGGTLGPVEQVEKLWGEDGKSPSVSGTPRYDLLCPAAGTYGRFNIVLPDGGNLAQPGALAIYVPELQLMGSNTNASDGFSAAVQEAAGQWMQVRGTQVPTGWSIEGGTVNPAAATKFWSSFPQFKAFKELAAHLQWGKLTFFPVTAEDAYPPEGETGIPANYKELVDGNLYVLTQGSFSADKKSRNNPSGLHFCRGTLKQKVKLKSLPQALPRGVKKEDILKIFSDAAKDDDENKTIRAATLVLNAVFIDRRSKRFQTGTNAEGSSPSTPEETESGTTAEEVTANDYRFALSQYYAQRQTLYNDVETEVVLNDISPATLLGCQLVVEQGQQTTSPIRAVSMDYVTRHARIQAGAPDMLSLDEFLELRNMVKNSFRATISKATSGELQTGRAATQRTDNIAPSVSPSIATSVESAAAKIVPFSVYRDGDKVYMAAGTLSRGGKTATMETTEIPPDILAKGTNFGPELVIKEGEAKIIITYDEK